MTTGLDPPSGDMSDWIIESTSSNWSLSTRRFISKLFTVQMPMKRNADFIFDRAREEPFSTMKNITMLIFAAGFALSVIMGAIGSEVLVPGVLATTFLLSFGVGAVTGLGCLIVTGNYYAYSTIWITTPQVGLMLTFLMK